MISLKKSTSNSESLAHWVIQFLESTLVIPFHRHYSFWPQYPILKSPFQASLIMSRHSRPHFGVDENDTMTFFDSRARKKGFFNAELQLQGPVLMNHIYLELFHCILDGLRWICSITSGHNLSKYNNWKWSELGVDSDERPFCLSQINFCTMLRRKHYMTSHSSNTIGLEQFQKVLHSLQFHQQFFKN